MIPEPREVRQVFLEETNAFLQNKQFAAKHITLATFCVILFPLWLLLLGAACETRTRPIFLGEASRSIVMLLAVFMLRNGWSRLSE